MDLSILKRKEEIVSWTPVRWPESYFMSMIVSKIIVVFEELFFFFFWSLQSDYLVVLFLAEVISPMIMFEESDSKLGNLCV